VVATLDRYSDAIETLDKEKVDLILCDVRLSGERTGIDLAKIAKGRGIPVVFSTGLAPDNAAELVFGCLMKPYSERTLKAALKAVDQLLAGRKVKPPKGLIIYEKAES
jgi:two-component SAPR family response regulator